MKKFLKIFSVFTSIIFVIFILLTYGLSTTKFNDKIKIGIEKQIEDVNLDFKKINISLNIKDFNLALKLIDPKMTYQRKDISLKKFEFFIKIIPVLKKQYLIDEVTIDLNNNEIKNISNIALSLKNLENRNIISNFLDGKIRGRLKLRFDENYKIQKFYFSGNIQQASIDIYDNLPFFTNINSKIIINNEELFIKNMSGRLISLNFFSDLIYKFKTQQVLGDIKLTGSFDNKINFKILKGLFKNKHIKNLKNFNGKINSNFKVDITFNNDFTIKTNNTKSNLKFNDLNLTYNLDKKDIYINKLNTEINITKNKISHISNFKLDSKKINSDGIYNNKTKKHIINLNGEFKPDLILKNSLFKDYVNLNAKVILVKNKIKNANLKLSLNNTAINLPYINYSKSKGKVAFLNFDLIGKNNNILIEKISYVSNKDYLIINDLNLDKDYNLKEFSKIKLNLNRNNFTIFKNKNLILIKGNSVDFSKLFKHYLNSKNSNSEFKQLDTRLNINIKNVYLHDDNLVNLKLNGVLDKGKFKKLSLFSNFSGGEIFTAEIIRNKKNNRILRIYSDKTKPLFGNINNLSGIYSGNFELNREYKAENFSTTTVQMNKFYIKDMPVLADILSVASITGALDILKGKGIYFDKSILKYNTINDEIKIENFYGSGPSLGYIIDGRIGSDNFFSLNGNIVPANTLNKIIRNIPLIGKVLTGKEGDGIFGASFKIKGKKDNLKTTVNPLKTLTPRFIQRFLSIFKS